jgi:hypothetical protein
VGVGRVAIATGAQRGPHWQRQHRAPDIAFTAGGEQPPCVVVWIAHDAGKVAAGAALVTGNLADDLIVILLRFGTVGVFDDPLTRGDFYIVGAVYSIIGRDVIAI